VLSMVLSAQALTKTCTVTSVAALQTCIDTGATAVGALKNDSLFAKFSGTPKPLKLVIHAKKNVWVIGDTVGAETARPTIVYSDAGQSLWTSSTYDLSGAVLVDSSRFITFAGITISGGASAGGTPFQAVYASGYSSWKGNNALSIRRSYGVRAIHCTFKNACRGILIRGENLGGASAYPNPQDPDSLVRQNLPTSNAGLYGRHVIEKCRIYDNSWGIVGDRDWDIGSVFRYNEFFDNYVRTANLLKDPWNQAGGAFFTDDVAITPYRIHNNTFIHNGVIFGAYYKAGTQHLFYDNLIGKPERYHKAGFNQGDGWYTQTERQTEMLKFFSEHQRSNVIEPQDDAFTDYSVTQLNGWPNFRMFRMKMDRGWTDNTHTATQSRNDARSYNPAFPDCDSVSLAWYVKEGVVGDSAKVKGGQILRIRQNMWVGSSRDPMDLTDSKDYGYAFLPKQITPFVATTASNDVFRDVSSFDLWWTPVVPFTDSGAKLTARTENFLRPLSSSAFSKNRIVGKGWPYYSSINGITSDIGALSVNGTGYSDNGMPQLELQDTLVESVSNDTIQFSINVFGSNGFEPSKLKNLRVVDNLSKFYRTVPVTDTIQNQSTRTANGTYLSGECNDNKNDTHCRTQVNSVLDSMPWPAAVSLTASKWVNDSLNKGLRSARYLYEGKFGGGVLDKSTNYARAEIVLAGEYDGKTIYSNPGVFIYAKPKYSMIVKVLEPDCKTELPLASDNISRKVRAGDSVCLQVKPNIDTNITMNFKPLFSDYSELMGSDTARMRIYRSSAWGTTKPGFSYDYLDSGKTLNKDSVFTVPVKFLQEGAGRLTMRTLFNMVGTTQVRDLRYLAGTSPRILVVPNTIYQATIDTMIYESDTAVPNLNWKLNHAERPYTDTNNVVNIPKINPSVATVVIHLRDAFGNIVSDPDSLAMARSRGLQIKISSPKQMFLYSASTGRHDSVYAIDSARIVLNGLYPYGGIGTYQPLVSSILKPSTSTDTTKFPEDTGWVAVVGKEDTVHAKDALIVDHDGDGNGDSVYIRLSTPLASYPAKTLIRWGSPAESLVVTDSMLTAWKVRNVTDSGVGDTLLAIPLPSAYNVAKGIYPVATWIHEQTTGPADTVYFPYGASVHIRDSVGPVTDSARMYYGATTDTVVLTLSEAIAGTKAGDSASVIAQLRKIFPSGSVVLDASGSTVRILIPSATNPLLPGDSLRLNPKSSGGILVDLSKNGAGDLNPWVRLQAGIRPIVPKDALIIDHDGDGNGDSVYVWIQNPLMTYPESILLRWGTAAETLTVTKAMLTAWGVRITDASGLGDTFLSIPLPSVLNVPKTYSVATWTHERTTGPADTAYFDSAKVKIRDGIGPVAVSAQLVFGDSFDILSVTLSENITGGAVGDSANAVFQLKKQLPAGAVITGISGNLVRISIPSGSNPLVNGDSLRLMPKNAGGVLTDMAKNGAGDRNPWILVKAGMRPPQKGWYLDVNGDGRVETALLRFVQNPRGACSSYSFHWPTLDSTRTPVTTACQLDSSSKDSLLWRVSFAPFAYGATGSSLATTTPLGQQNPTVDDPTSYRFFMYDSVGPVLLDSAYLKDNANTASISDTLRIVPSEAVVAATVGNSTARLIVQFKRGNAIVADSLVKIQALNCPDVSHCLLSIAVSSSYRPSPGDSVRLSVKDSVFDATISRNAPSVNNPFQMIHGKPRPPYYSAYFDRDHDGRIDSVALAFTVAPAVGTVIEVGDPSGATSEVRRYTVTAADAGKTSIGFNIDPWGANVTSVSTSTIARLIDPATKDSTRFSLADSVAPVILSATISYTSDRTGNTPDTLRITSSELVKYDPSQGLSFYYKPNGQDTLIAFKLDVVSMTFDSLTGQWTILVKPLGDSHPVALDSLRFAPGNSVVDASGNHVGTEAKYTQIVELRPRILVPLVKVETPITSPSGPSSAPFQMLVSSQQGSTASWMPMNSKNFVGNVGNPKQGHVVISFSSNMPSQMHVYVYDHLGVYVNDYALNITKEFLASAPQNKMGEVVLGIAWDGTSASGTLVNNGIYMVRLVTQRDMTSYETNTLGKHTSELENEIVKVGIAR